MMGVRILEFRAIVRIKRNDVYKVLPKSVEDYVNVNYYLMHYYDRKLEDAFLLAVPDQEQPFHSIDEHGCKQ